MGTPQPLGDGLVNRVKSWQENGFFGGLMYLGGSESQLGLDSFLFARLMWDPDQDVDVLTDKYFQGCYGNSAAYVKQFYEIIAQRRQQLTQYLHTQALPVEVRGSL